MLLYPKCLACSHTSVNFFLICFQVTSLWSSLAASEIHKGTRSKQTNKTPPWSGLYNMIPQYALKSNSVRTLWTLEDNVRLQANAFDVAHYLGKHGEVLILNDGSPVGCQASFFQTRKQVV